MVNIIFITALFIFAGVRRSSCFHHPNLKLLPKECGEPGSDKPYELTGQPVNATVGQIPWVALLGYKDNGKIKYKCYGALISERYVVTVSECALECSFGVPVSAHFGEVNITTEKGCDQPDCEPLPQSVEIEDVLINAKFRKNWKNNIALLRLKTPVNITKTVSPICLPLSGDSKGSLHDATVLVTAWVEKANVDSHYFPQYKYQHYGKAAMAVQEQISLPDTPPAEGKPASTVAPAGKPCRRCQRMRGLGYLQYSADLVINGEECRAQFAQGVECTDCQFSTEGTLCTEADPFGEPQYKHDCSRQRGAPVAYHSNSTNTLSLVGLVLQSDSYCQYPAPVLSTKIADHLGFILDGMKE